MAIPYYNGSICLNVLGNSLENAEEIYREAEGHVLVGVLSSRYSSTEVAIEDMKRYAEILEGNLSVGLGAGNPRQWQMVARIGKAIKANHFNQVFSAVGYTRAMVGDESSHINALVSPSGTPGLVVISTGPLSSEVEQPAIVPIDTAIAMVREMGGNAIKFFPMGGLSAKEELIAVAAACARADFVLEPTGGIDKENFEEIMRLLLDMGVRRMIPHIYSAIIDPNTGDTKVEDVRTLYQTVQRLLEE